ncbi:MAG: glycosyltransferase family 2 protein [Armatimonadota bacterium]
MLCVAVVFDRSKAYALPALLPALAALERPEPVRFLFVIAGALTRRQAAYLREFAERQPAGAVEIVRGPRLPAPAWGQPFRDVALLRERLHAALAAGAEDWVLLLDADVIPEPDTLTRIQAHGQPCVSALVLGRRNGQVCADPWRGRPGLQLVEWTGLGCMLLDGDVAREISFAPFLAGKPGGEDVWFCRELARRGGRVLLDPEVCPWHVDGTGLAVRAEWRDETMSRKTKTVEDLAPAEAEAPPITRAMLVPRISGYSARFGTLEEGRPFCADASGAEISEEEVRALAAQSEFLDLVEPAAA